MGSESWSINLNAAYIRMPPLTMETFVQRRNPVTMISSCNGDFGLYPRGGRKFSHPGLTLH